MILEAMKMENEIIAPCAGTVSNLSVQKGSTVSSGQLLCSIG
jgi:biotin carboxyl carrier protein